MMYATPYFVLSYLFPQKEHICIYLTKSDFQHSKCYSLKRRGCLDWPRKQPTSNDQKCRDSRVLCRHHKPATRHISKVSMRAGLWESEPQRDSHSLDKLPGYMRSQDTYTLKSKTAQLPVMNDKRVAETERWGKRSKKGIREGKGFLGNSHGQLVWWG